MERRDFAGPFVTLLRRIRARVAPPSMFTFSGYEWWKKQSVGRVGPGPCKFSTENVSLEKDGALRLSIASDKGQWSCAEIISRKSFGYGTYRFYVRDTSALDVNAILGLFTWDTAEAAKAHAYREIDVEVGRWGDVTSNNCQFVVQPATSADHVTRFEAPAGPAIHEFTWTPAEVSFRSITGYDANAESKVISQRVFTDGIPPAGSENARINLWLLGGQSPLSGKRFDIIIDAFKFQPLP